MEIGIGQYAVHVVDEGAKFAGVEEEGLLAAVADAAFGGGVFVFGEEPAADGNLRSVEELAGESLEADGAVELLDSGLENAWRAMRVVSRKKAWKETDGKGSVRRGDGETLRL